MPNYTYVCGECESSTEEFSRYADRPETVPCACGGVASHTITATGLVMKEAYIDGTRRKGFSEIREANKLQRELRGRGSETDKKMIRSELKKLKVETTKE